VPLAIGAFPIEPVLKPLAFLCRQPTRFPWPVGQIEIDRNRHGQGGQGLDDEDPLPAMQAPSSFEIED
jgi:hypothetical protein